MTLAYTNETCVKNNICDVWLRCLGPNDHAGMKKKIGIRNEYHESMKQKTLAVVIPKWNQTQLEA